MTTETVSGALYDAMSLALKDIEAVLARHGCPAGATMTDWIDEQLTALAATAKPIDMLLLCPACGMQHIDAVETGTTLSRSGLDTLTETEVVTWSNPPHRSHMCHGCGHQWRPADVATNGVAELKTKGRNDSPPAAGQRTGERECRHCGWMCRPNDAPSKSFYPLASATKGPTPAQERALDEMTADAQRLGLYDMPNPTATVHKPSAQPVWRCFHCDEAFADAESAALHFGKSVIQSPACLIDIAEYRAMEQRMRRYTEEDTDLHREIHALQAQHQTALMREEEKGYARGLADGIKEAAKQQAEPVGDERSQQLAVFLNLADVVQQDAKKTSDRYPAQSERADQLAAFMRTACKWAAQSGQRSSAAELPIKGAWIDGGYVIVTPSGTGNAPAVKAAILALAAPEPQKETAQ